MDTFTKAERSRIMSRIRSVNTGPELVLRRALWAAGFRYRVNYGKERIDIAFPGNRIAVFVDGCFWHTCPKHATVPKSRRDYWVPKLEANIRRAKEKDERLENAGWRTIHIWEHDLDNPENVVALITEAIGRDLRPEGHA